MLLSMLEQKSKYLHGGFEIGGTKNGKFFCVLGWYHATNWDECGFFCFANKRFNILHFHATLIYTTIISLLPFLFDAIIKNYNNDSSLSVSIKIMNRFFSAFHITKLLSR